MKIITVVCTYLLMVAPCFAHDYSCREKRACRCSASNPCSLETRDGMSESECESRCDGKSNCEGYEWTSTNKRCEIHKVRGNNFSDSSQNRDDTECCWRVTSSGGSKSSKSGGSKSSKGGRRLGHADEDPRRQVSRHGRDLAAGRKLRGHALRSGQKMDAFNAWE